MDLNPPPPSLVSARDALPAGSPGLGSSQGASARRVPAIPAPGSSIPKSDLGTVVLHAVAGVAMIASLLTGLRLSADQLDSVVAKFMAPILPQGEVWTVHFVSSVALFFAMTAYVLYLVRGGLRRRVALRKVRAFTLPTGAKLRWAAANVALTWAFYALTLVLTVTGVMLYLGHGGWVVKVHATSALTVLGYIVAHLVAHFGYGGWRQWLRVFNPDRLVPNRSTRRLPFAVAGFVGLPVAAGLAYVDVATRGVLQVHKVGGAPTLDGQLDDEVWRAARPVFVRTQQGNALSGTGESAVEVRAVRDDKRIYFAFRWEDPTRSMFRLPVVKHEDGWRVMGVNGDISDVNDFYEDKFAVLFSHRDGFGGGASTGMGSHPIAGRPSALHERGLHYTTDGSYMDMWQWKASRGGMIGYMDDQYFGPPRNPTPDEAVKKARYQGGYWNDPGKAFYTYNFPFSGPGSFAGPITPKRLPKDPKAMMAAMGAFDAVNPEAQSDEAARTWMMEAESEPYTAEADAHIPVGTVMPGVLISGQYEGDRADIRAGARWQDGYWTIETSRALATGSRYDIDFVPGQTVYMWVAVFDHTQTRHTRHVRPVLVELR